MSEHELAFIKLRAAAWLALIVLGILVAISIGQHNDEIDEQAARAAQVAQ